MNDMIRIAVVTPFFPNGTESYGGRPIYQSVVALQRLARVEVFCTRLKYPRWRILQPRRWLYRPVDPKDSPPGVRVHYIQYPALPVISRPFHDSICTLYLQPHLEQFRPDVILAYWLYPEGYVALRIGKRLGIPVVLGARGSDLLVIRDSGILGKVKDSLQRAAFVLTVTEDMRQKAISLGARPDCVRTVYNGCDTSIFRIRGRAESRAALGVAPDSQLIVFVGRLMPIKGVRELLEAMSLLVPSHPRLELVFIGDDFMGGTLQARAAQPDLSGHVRFLGIRTPTEIARWYAAANLVCLPSHSEGCPNVVLEALSCGRPLVASNAGGIPELVDSRCAILVPPKDPVRLAEAVAEALQRPWDETEIASCFGRTWDAVAQETFEVCGAAVEKCALEFASMRA